MFLALDLAGEVHGLALCRGPTGREVVPAWPIRCRVTQAHFWPVTDGGDSSFPHEILAVADRWAAHLNEATLVVLTAEGRGHACGFAASGGCRHVRLPRGSYFLSPRGISPAGYVRDYHRRLAPQAPVNLHVMRNAFVDMMEQAADDVQADGYEQDDSILDRYAEIAIGGQDQRLLVPVETVTDLEWLLESWQAACAAWWGRFVSPDVIEILSLRLRCAIEPPGRQTPRQAPGEHPAEIIPPHWRWEVSPEGDVVCHAHQG